MDIYLLNNNFMVSRLNRVKILTLVDKISYLMRVDVIFILSFWTLFRVNSLNNFKQLRMLRFSFSLENPNFLPNIFYSFFNVAI
jgi:hypothetical protein